MFIVPILYSHYGVNDRQIHNLFYSLLVIGFHAYSRYPAIVPYDEKYQDIFIFKYGWLGVPLFFLISGFVILMTLEKTNNTAEFLYRRWLRLFPAMLIASILIYSSADFFVERPAGTPSPSGILSGISFISSEWWNSVLHLFGKQIAAPIEGAFWTLFVEAKFYVISALLYFSLGRKKLLVCLILFYLSAVLLNYISVLYDNVLINVVDTMIDSMSFIHFGWFTAGALFYLFYQTKDFGWFYCALAVSILSSLVVGEFNLEMTIATLIISSLFATSLVNQRLQRILMARSLLFFGFISYPLYLIHENMMISMIIKLDAIDFIFPDFLYPLVPIFILSFFAYAIASFGEPVIKSMIKKAVIFLKL